MNRDDIYELLKLIAILLATVAVVLMLEAWAQHFLAIY